MSAKDNMDVPLNLDPSQESANESDSEPTDSEEEMDTESEGELDPDDPLNAFIHDEGEDEMTAWMESVPIDAFAIWNLMVRSAGATAVFTYNGTTLCHFEDSTLGMQFVLRIASYPNLPLLVDVIDETTDAYWTRVNEIKENPPQGEFIWAEM